MNEDDELCALVAAASRALGRGSSSANVRLEYTGDCLPPACPWSVCIGRRCYAANTPVEAIRLLMADAASKGERRASTLRAALGAKP